VRRWSAVNLNIIKDAATSSVLTSWTGEAVAGRRTVPPVMQFHGIGLPPFGAGAARFYGIGVDAVATTDSVQGLGVVDRGVGDPGIPPRWGPSRC
jgi:hypothetical protein